MFLVQRVVHYMVLILDKKLYGYFSKYPGKI